MFKIKINIFYTIRQKLIVFIFAVSVLNLISINKCYSDLELNSNDIFVNENYRNLPRHKPVPGGLAIIPLDLDTIHAPIIFFNKKRILVLKYKNDLYGKGDNQSDWDWLAIVGIPMGTKPGVQKIQIFKNNETDNFIEKSFLVSNKHYLSEKLRLSNKFTDPSLIEQSRINKERKLASKAYNHWSDAIPNLTLRSPILKSYKSSSFGLKRILNGQLKGFHSGVDLAAPIGTNVYPASSGKVILTGSFFYSGNVIFVDHGQGFITNYCHLNSIAVKEGDLVYNDTVLGTVGATGRVTGPHLHWSVSLNDTRVDPELFLFLQ